jgi:hypothetical protein
MSAGKPPRPLQGLGAEQAVALDPRPVDRFGDVKDLSVEAARHDGIQYRSRHGLKEVTDACCIGQRLLRPDA